jgi:hypothetical protein
MTSSFDPDDVEKFLPAIAAVARAGLGAAKVGAKAAGKVASAASGAASKVTEVGAKAASKTAEAAKTAGSNIKETAGKLKEQAATAMESGTPENKKLQQTMMVQQGLQQRQQAAEQQKRDQQQRASEMARSAASTGSAFAKAWVLLKEEVAGSDQHASTGDSRFWDVMRHYGYYDPHAVNQAFEPYPIQRMTELSPQVDELIASYGYKPYYFGGRYPMPDLKRRNYESGHLAIYDPEVRTAGFSDTAFTDNWRKLHELGHALGLEDINAKWGEGRRLGKLGVRTPREMLRAVDWERAAMENQRDLMNEVGLQITPEAQYNKDWNTTIGDAAFRAITGKFTSPETEGFVPFSEKIPLDIAMRKVRERADELGLDMDETLRDKRGGARKIASEPMDFAWQLLLKQQTFNDYFGIKDQWISLPKEGMDQRPELYDEVAEAMNIAYAPIGGHAKYKNADDLRGEGKHARYDLIDNDEDPYVDAAHVFQETEQGFKSSVLGQDGSRAGRRAVVGHAVEAMNTPGHFMEASGPMASVLERNQVGVVESPEMIQRVLADKDIRMHPDGGGVYTRTIGDEEHEKRIFGQPLENAVAVTQPYMEQVYDRQSMTNPFDLFGKSNEFMEDAFDMGYELVDYDDLHDKQRAIVDFISYDKHVPSYWTDPASGEYETEWYAPMFQQDSHHRYPDEAYEQYHRYLQHYFEAAKDTAALPFEKQSFLMSGTEEANSHPEHPDNIALARMAEEFPEWDIEDPHAAFYHRYNEPEPQRGLASRMASGGFLRSEVLVKERKSPEAMRHKREYDAAYNKRPDQVKYREELNQERRRRGIMGSHDHMDVSHTQGHRLTLEPEHSNRARHWKDKGTLRVMKSMKEDLALLRNLMQGPMDEQDKKIATAMMGMLEERHAEDEGDEDDLSRPMFGGGDLFL